jgi:signal transduction histidine kinase
MFLKKVKARPDELILEVKINAANIAKSKGIEFVKSIEEGLPEIEVDRSYILRALMNLTVNALNFTQDGGRVEIGAGLASEGGREFVCMRVIDNGPGITEHEQAKVFEKYYRSQKTLGVKGSGLGLAIVRAIAESHGGRVTLESTPGEGSVFSILIPVSKGS